MAMNDRETEALITDHYVGEAQTLTTGAEHNLLKLQELRGRLTDEERVRWEEIRRDFRRIQMMGGQDDDPVARVTGSLGGLAERLEDIHGALAGPTAEATARQLSALDARLGGIHEVMQRPREGRASASVREHLTSRLDALVEALSVDRQQAVAEELAGLRELLGKCPHVPARASEPLSASATPDTSMLALRALTAEFASLRQVVASATTASELDTNREEGFKVQARLLDEALDALEGRVQRRRDDPVLDGALTVIRYLTNDLTELVSNYTDDDTRARILEQLRRDVAESLVKLAMVSNVEMPIDTGA